LLPVLGFIRFPIKFVVLAAFAVPLLAAFGLDWIQRRADESGRAVRRGLTGVAAFLLLVVLLLVFLAFRAPVENESWQRTASNGASRAVFLVVILAGAWWAARLRLHQRWLALVLLLGVSLDGLTHMPRQNPTVASAAFGPLQIQMSRVARLGEGRAMIRPVTQSFLENASPTEPAEIVLGHRRTLFSNCNLIEGVPKVNGFFSLYLKEEADVRTLLYRSTNALSARLADFLGAAQISSAQELFEWTLRTNALPLVTIGQRPVFADGEETLRGLASPVFDPRQTVYLPSEARSFVSTSPPGRAQVISNHVTSQRVQVEVETTTPAMLVVAQSFYHPWRATVDGRATRIWRANHAFQALEVPAGSRRVELVYRDWNFRTGAILSVLTLFTGGLMWFRLRSKEPEPLSRGAR
jgi:hypothetical protein